MTQSFPLKLFITYSRQDIEYLRNLELHLNLLVKSGKLQEIWSDGKIDPGSDWDLVIKSNLSSADIIVLLISVDFFNSDYIEKEELKIAFKRHKNLDAIVIPILVRPCHWASHYQIQSLQVLPRNTLPVENWRSQDQAFTEIIQEIELVVTDFSKRKYAFIEQNLNNAINLYNTKQYDEAFQIFNKYLPTQTVLDREAAYKMGNFYFYPFGSVKLNYDTAKYWFEIAANWGSTGGQNNLGVIHLEGRGVSPDPYKASQYFFSASNQGEETAQYNLAGMFKSGNGIQPNLEEAVRLYTLSAQKGYLGSQYQLGKMYLDGVGVEKNFQEGITWIQRAAELGFAEAQAYLGATYLDKALPDTNFSNAIYWADKAAQQNYGGGYYLMGVIYKNGYGVTANKAFAIKYFKSAATLGNTSAADELKEMGV